MTNQSLVDIYKLEGSGMVLRDVVNTDKQDDGASRHIFHSNAFVAMMMNGSTTGELCIRPGFEGVSMYLFVLSKNIA